MTKRQRDCLEIIKAFIAEHGYSPSYKEIKESLGVASTSRVSDLIHALRDQGYITFGFARRRNIRVIYNPDVVVAARKLLIARKNGGATQEHWRALEAALG